MDDLSNSYESAFVTIQNIASQHWVAMDKICPILKLHKLNYRSPLMRQVLGRYAIRDPSLPGSRLSHIVGVIHFAAYKSVEESIYKPMDYYLNNVAGLIDLMILLGDFGIFNFVFSSSATVYGSALNEGRPLCEDELVHHGTTQADDHGLAMERVSGVRGLTSPYGRTKYFGEAILADIAFANPCWRITALRYFNPVGCEPSGLLAEEPRMAPTNLFPVISQVLAGERPTLEIFGSDWESSDGTAVRDFIHVVDLAQGHIAALTAAAQRDEAFRAYNLGTGTGSTVAQVVSCMELAAGRSLPVQRTGRRAGDVGCCVAQTERAARELRWRTQRSLQQCATDTWRRLTLSGKVAA